MKIDADLIAFPRNNNKDGDDDVNDDVVVVPRATAITRFISRVKNLEKPEIISGPTGLLRAEMRAHERKPGPRPKEYGKYVKSAITQKIERVPRPDFKDVWDYASGKVTFSERIDLTSDVGATVPVLDGSGATTTTIQTTTKTTGVDDEMDDDARAAARKEKGLRVGRRRR